MPEALRQRGVVQGFFPSWKSILPNAWNGSKNQLRQLVIKFRYGEDADCCVTLYCERMREHGAD
jgi:hypothetical protein